MRTDNGIFSHPEYATEFEFDDEFDIGEELSLDKAAELMQKFMKDLPDDMIDIDTGNEL